tara:strand:- start:159 stop:527 length:369 start_codon:yes stop_codon:yes gene_type:complete
MTRKGHTYNPKSADFWKMHVGMAAKEALADAPTPFSCPVILRCEFYMPRPKRLKASEVNVPHTKRPDTDNLLKSTQDALQMASVVTDDSVFYDVTGVKHYADPDEQSHARISIILVRPALEE